MTNAREQVTRAEVAETVRAMVRIAWKEMLAVQRETAEQWQLVCHRRLSADSSSRQPVDRKGFFRWAGPARKGGLKSANRA